MELEDRMLRLIAVGASIGANCQRCLAANVMKAREQGADEQEIAEAIEIGRMVRNGAASKMDKFASGLDARTMSIPDAPAGGCECN